MLRVMTPHLGHALGDLLAAASLPAVGPKQLIGVAMAVVGAVLMSLSAMLQHRGVSRVDDAAGGSGGDGLGAKQMAALLRQPAWLIGTGLIGLAIVLQLGALAFAPLVVIQPVGVISLVITTLITARQTGLGMRPFKSFSVALCVVGVAAFVTVAAIFAVDAPIGQTQLVIVLGILAALIAALTAAFLWLRRTRYRSLFYIVAGGALYGFIATLAKVVIGRIREGDIGWLTILCIVGLLAALAVGSYFVQTAYASGSADLVVAGLTVIDPMVAVVIGIAVLGETAGAPWWAYLLFVIAGAVSVSGVYLLEVKQDPEEVARARADALGARDRAAPTGGASDPIPESGEWRGHPAEPGN